MAMGRSADSERVAFWRELIERRRHSGLSIAQVCGEAGVSTASFYLWQRKLRGGVAARRQALPDRRGTSRLVPVRILADAPANHGDSVGMLEVDLPGEIRLRIPAGCDAATLQLVFGMLLRNGGGEGGSC
jgi:hypothetical protein